MPIMQAFECDICGNLYRKAFTVIVEADGVKFTYKDNVDQSKLVIISCGECLDQVGSVIKGALQ